MTAPVFEIDDYSPAENVNPYTAHVKALIDAGEGKVMTIRVETERANRDRVLFQKAANAAEKTARVVETSEDADKGETAITFRLKPKEAARPGRGGRKPAEAAEAAEKPAQPAQPAKGGKGATVKPEATA